MHRRGLAGAGRTVPLPGKVLAVTLYRVTATAIVDADGVTEAEKATGHCEMARALGRGSDAIAAETGVRWTVERMDD